jgi:hypothetical protein
VTVAEPVVRVDEGEWAMNGGSVVDLDGRLVGLAVSMGDIVAQEGAWSWSYYAADGPGDSEAVKIRATDEDGASGYGAFDLVVRNVAPEVELITEASVVAQVGWPIQATLAFTDPGALDVHIGVITWGDGSVCNTSTGPDCSIDQGSGIHGSVSAVHTYAEPGLYAIAVTVTDDDGGSDVSTFEAMVVYDPQVGSMTGGGWFDSPPGAYVLDPSLAGRGEFSFDVKYSKGAQVPKGELRFVFGDGILAFYSSSYEWMTITGGSDAVLAGRGTIDDSLAPDGEPYRFTIWASDRGRGRRGGDTFHIRIWWGADQVVYDNGADQEIGRGSIVVHAKR